MTKEQQLLSDLVVHKNYARYNDLEGRRETYDEVALRSMDYMLKTYPMMRSEIVRSFKYVLDKKVVPSMRMMQFAGKPTDMMPNRIYNCGFMALNDTACFSELMFLLLGGSGIGLSVEQYHVARLPVVQPPTRAKRFMVQDSIVGWADAVKVLMKSYFEGKYHPTFDFSDVRPKGSALKTSGGSAPGPEPLDRALNDVNMILRKAIGRQLLSVEVFDICCHIASAVFAGGIRRAALIVIFTESDEDMLHCKDSEWYVDNAHRCRANISAALYRDDPDIKQKVTKLVTSCKHNGFGEPGIVYLSDRNHGYNPCGEIYLEDCSFCNLTEVVATDDLGELNARLRAASSIGTLQAGLTDFFYLRDKWRLNCERNPLIGVSMTNFCSTNLSSAELEKANSIVTNWNSAIAESIGINKASRVTCVKPSGSTSLVLGTSSGIHPWYSEYFTRTLEIEEDSELYKYLVSRLPPTMFERSVYNYKNWVIKFPVKAPEGAITNTKDTTVKALERILTFNQNFIGRDTIKADRSNNVSCTVYMYNDMDWQLVIDFLTENYLTVGGVSLYSFSNNNFEQPVLKEITEEEYNSMVEEWKDVKVNLHEVLESTDQTDLAGAIACSGGACEISL